MRATSKVLACVLCVSVLVVTATPCVARADVGDRNASHGDPVSVPGIAQKAHDHSQPDSHREHTNHSAPARHAGHGDHTAPTTASEDAESPPHLTRPCACGCGDAPARKASANGRLGFAIGGALLAAATPGEIGELVASEDAHRTAPVSAIDPDPA